MKGKSVKAIKKATKSAAPAPKTGKGFGSFIGGK